jgi:hypothetical protein
MLARYRAAIPVPKVHVALQPAGWRQTARRRRISPADGAASSLFPFCPVTHGNRADRIAPTGMVFRNPTHQLGTLSGGQALPDVTG